MIFRQRVCRSVYYRFVSPVVVAGSTAQSRGYLQDVRAEQVLNKLFVGNNVFRPPKMRVAFGSFAAAAAVICSLAGVAVSIGSHPDVIELTEDNFQSTVDSHDVMLIEFFAPWCGHCKRLAPEYEKAASQLKKDDSSISLAKVDCTAHQGVCSKYGVGGYPTLKIFRNGEFSKEYNGPREAAGIVRYMISEAGPASRELTTKEEVDKFLNHAEHSVVGFFSDASSAAAKAYTKLADGLKENLRFAHVSKPELLKEYQDYTEKTVLFQPPRLHSKLEPTRYICNDDEDLKSCIKNRLHGLVGHKTSRNAQDFEGAHINVLWDVDYDKNAKGSNYWRNRIIKVADKFKDNVKFAFSSWNEFQGELSEYGIEKTLKDHAPIVVARDANGKKYVMPEEFSIENLEKFARSFVDQKLEPYLKSEAVPSSNDEGVKIVVAKNFDEIVNDPSKDVLIEFYAPWCGHCKKLTPIYDELGAAMKNEPNLVIAKMDATANDVPSQYTVRGFPTIFFKKRGRENSPQSYEGGRELNDFVKYLSKESSEELSGYDRKGKKQSTKSEL